MNRQNILFAIVALLIAGVLTYFIFFWTNVKRSHESRAYNEDEFTSNLQILVAAVDIPFGKKLEHLDIRWQNWPKEGLSPKHAVKGARDLNDFIGGITRVPIIKGQPIIDDSIIKPSHHSVMANIMKPGMRAVSINVDRASGVSGFIFPGDFVDVILTIRQTTGSDTKVVSETIMKNVKVLALDQSTSRTTEETAKLAKTVTLEVSPKQAENLAIANNLGNLSLSLHSIEISHDASQGQSSDLASTPPMRSKITIIRDKIHKELELEH